MLSDREAAEIESGRKQGLGGPLILKWIDALLADRKERIQQLEYLRQRLNQAFRYLDALVHDVQRGRRVQPPRPPCPRCGKPYVQARGSSPAGIVYAHGDGRECRTG
jgi:hypothetical protein